MNQKWIDRLSLFGKSFFGKVLLAGVAYPILTGPLKRKRFILGAAAGEGGGARVYFNRIEPEQTRAFVDSVRAGQTVFDIGANVGYYTLLGSTLVGAEGMVIAFEPVVRNLFYLYRHIALNKVVNVIIIPAACSDHCSIANFSLGDNCAVGHLEQEPARRRYNPKNIAVVPTITVDEVVKFTNISPDVLKIDVEGAELLVLQGARDTLTKTKPIVFLSVHSSDLRSACLNFLIEMGYAFQLLNGGEHGAGELLATRA